MGSNQIFQYSVPKGNPDLVLFIFWGYRWAAFKCIYIYIIGGKDEAGFVDEQKASRGVEDFHETWLSSEIVGFNGSTVDLPTWLCYILL